MLELTLTGMDTRALKAIVVVPQRMAAAESLHVFRSRKSYLRSYTTTAAAGGSLAVIHLREHPLDLLQTVLTVCRITAR